MPELAAIEIALFLRSVRLFQYCSAEQTMRLAAIARERRVAPGEVLFRPGDPATELYCVVEGVVELEGEEGPAVEVAERGTFGVVEILSGRLRGRRATAGDETLVVAMSANDFFDLLANNIEIVKALFRRVLEGSDGDAEALL